MSQRCFPDLGCGVGLRSPHYPHILGEKPDIGFFEAISENYMDSEGRPIEVLEKIRRDYPLALHGVSLSIGSADPINREYLKQLMKLIERVEPQIVSDHLCWTGIHGENLHDLLPLPHTESVIEHVVERVKAVQDYLKRRILLENQSTYVGFEQSEMAEWEFLTEVAERSGCGILLDINNVYVNAFNHGFDADLYIESVPQHLVAQFHLAGHTDKGEYYFDTHDRPVIDPVWKLYERAVERFRAVSTLIEWDENIPDFPKLESECRKAERIREKVLGSREKTAAA